MVRATVEEKTYRDESRSPDNEPPLVGPGFPHSPGRSRRMQRLITPQLTEGDHSMATLGTAVADITPGHPVELAGFAGRHGPMTGVRAPLELQVFAFGEPEITAVLVCADLLVVGAGRRRRPAESDRRRAGIPAEAVLLHASHTHSGPQPGMTFSTLVGRGDPDYLAFLRSTTLAAVAAAAADLEPVTVCRGRGRSDLALNRRLAASRRRSRRPGSFRPVRSRGHGDQLLPDRRLGEGGADALRLPSGDHRRPAGRAGLPRRDQDPVGRAAGGAGRGRVPAGLLRRHRPESDRGRAVRPRR